MQAKIIIFSPAFLVCVIFYLYLRAIIIGFPVYETY